jgi:hypothetical protein
MMSRMTPFTHANRPTGSLGPQIDVKPADFNKFMEAVMGLGIYWLLVNQPLP